MKSLLLSVVSFLTIQAASFAGVDLGSSTSHTPYDPYMQPVKRVLCNLNHQGASMDKAANLMQEGRSFRYSFTTPYVAATPDVTAATKSGDCKAKALWLASQLDDKNVRFVVGKCHASSKVSHAWVMWKHEDRWWILDCTNDTKPVPADAVSSSDYIAQYSWSTSGAAYRHGSTQNGVADVSSKKSSPVASDRQ